MRKVRKQEHQPRPFSTEPADPIVRFMAKNNMRYDRQTYLECLFAFDCVPEVIDPEIEAGLPTDLRLKHSPGDWEEIE